ncbi:MAG TPA: class I tRNA ligase family protein, partial [Casimicrobiaceae bacterium]
ADLYLEGSDQHRGWFHSSLLTSSMLNGRPPYDALLTHGFVVDGSGLKMSKSKGNVVAPQKISSTYGAEILRLWVAATDYSGELSISDEILKRVVESYRRIRNTLRFLLANTADFDAAEDAVPPRELFELDRHALAVAHSYFAEFAAAYERFEFHPVVQQLQTFCSEELGGFYLDILKDRLYTATRTSPARRSAQTALALIRDEMLKFMAPVLSFTAEEAWRIIHPQDASVFVHTWRKQVADIGLTSEFVAKWDVIRSYRSELLKKLEAAREAGEIGSSLQAEVDIEAPPGQYEALASLGDDLRFVFITSAARVTPGPERLIRVTRSEHRKCERCWHYRADVGGDAIHSGLCGRCVANLFGSGEPRAFA